MIKLSVLTQLIAFKFGYVPALAESIAKDMIRDDFPKNGIHTMGQVVAFLDFVLVESRG